MSKTWEEHQKRAPFKKYSWVLSDVRAAWFQHKDPTKSDMAAKSKKYFLLGYKFIEYTRHQFCLSLACRKGTLQVGKTDRSCFCVTWVTIVLTRKLNHDRM